MYMLNQAQGMYFLVHAWKAVKPETIRNCWEKATILPSSSSNVEQAPEEVELLIEDDVREKFNELRQEFPLFEGISDITEDIDLTFDEDSINILEPSLLDSVSQPENLNEEEIDEEEEVEEEVDVSQRRSEVKAAIETLLGNYIPGSEFEHKMIKHLCNQLKEIRAEEVSEMKQARLTSYFTHNN